MTHIEQSERKGLVERLRTIAHEYSMLSLEEASGRLNVTGAPRLRALEAEVITALPKIADLLSSDARPAPMAEEVKAAVDAAVDEAIAPFAKRILAVLTDMVDAAVTAGILASVRPKAEGV